MVRKRMTAERWQRLWPAVGQDISAGWYERLMEKYEEPQRHYHTVQHIEECLREFDRTRAFADEPNAIELAIWFHDAVYEPRATDNEEQSASLAAECLKNADAPESASRTVQQLVLATKHHTAQTPDQWLLIDIDLSILGAPAERFLEYERQIRQEYSWVPDDVFREKRTEILRRFLSRSQIYNTEYFVARYEKQARANLRLSLQRLAD